MTFSVTIQRDGDAGIHVAVAGHVVGSAALDLRLWIIEAIVIERPDTILIDLQDVTALNAAGVNALLGGYVAATSQGTSYRVLHAPDPVRQVLQAAGVMDVLADSNDLGALLLAALTRPVARGQSQAQP